MSTSIKTHGAGLSPQSAYFRLESRSSGNPPEVHLFARANKKLALQSPSGMGTLLIQNSRLILRVQDN